MAEATQPGAQQQQDPKQRLDPKQRPNAEEYVNPRDAILDSMEEKIAADRKEEVDRYNAELRSELEQEGEMPIAPDPKIPTDADGSASVQPMHEPSPEPSAAPQQPEVQDDILAEHIVMHDGQPMFKAKVDGQDMLIPLDRARQQIQKHEAAEVRLQNATAMQRQLETREAALQQNEAALQTRMAQLTQAPPSAGTTDVDDPEALLGEAKELVSSLFTQDEDTAALNLAKLLSKSRAPAQAPAPVIDEAQLVARAATVAVAEMTKQQVEEDAKTGFKRFRKDYPDIMRDRNLYAMADAMTDEIAVEFPDYKPSEVMVEAGNRVREWVKEMKGEKKKPDPDDLNPKPKVTLEDRQQRKEGLVPIPTAGTAQQQELHEEDEEAETPADVLAEYRKSRGQPN